MSNIRQLKRSLAHYISRRKIYEKEPYQNISVNELDPLRDEGLDYYRKLLAAGVNTESRTVNGTTHAGDVIFKVTLPGVYAATARDINGFAKSL